MCTQAMVLLDPCESMRAYCKHAVTVDCKQLLQHAPENSSGSCGMMAICRRSSRSGTVATSTPSNITLPPSMSIRLSNASKSDDLPEPVRPTTPQMVSEGMLKVRPLRTRGRPGLYRACKRVLVVKHNLLEI